ncbi:Aste57867_21499 [Aphanomyces stellatus]|uniref:Aste57867_21499 protein n=1 Tax=Aphanomyces stellatus TaxID=120398 RepID=A0A485LJR9_9STRA|nr:hypothetical protein As57867_021430 [Aphanomyces stellatus]VFT98169.1 Aste57867_21499 [Aphanomyces stellatus]
MVDLTKMHKTGFLYKKSSGRGVLRQHIWKRRHVDCTRTELKYFDSERDESPRGSLDLTICRVRDVHVMPDMEANAGKSASPKWHVAIQTPDQRFDFAADTEVEMLEWVALLRAIFDANERYLLHQDNFSDESRSFALRHLKRLDTNC